MIKVSVGKEAKGRGADIRQAFLLRRADEIANVDAQNPSPRVLAKYGPEMKFAVKQCKILAYSRTIDTINQFNMPRVISQVIVLDFKNLNHKMSGLLRIIMVSF